MFFWLFIHVFLAKFAKFWRIQALYDRFAYPTPFVHRVRCTVQHHEQNPTFGDEVAIAPVILLSQIYHRHCQKISRFVLSCFCKQEEVSAIQGFQIKIRLPLTLDPSDHLLFTFTHIAISSAMQKTNEVSSVYQKFSFSHPTHLCIGFFNSKLLYRSF